MEDISTAIWLAIAVFWVLLRLFQRARRSAGPKARAEAKRERRPQQRPSAFKPPASPPSGSEPPPPIEPR